MPYHLVNLGKRLQIRHCAQPPKVTKESASVAGTGLGYDTLGRRCRKKMNVLLVRFRVTGGRKILEFPRTSAVIYPIPRPGEHLVITKETADRQKSFFLRNPHLREGE